MGMTVLAADSLLGYAIEPDPEPLTVSTAKDPVIGRLDITLGPGNSGSAYCKSVTVRIPIGAGATALTENGAQLTSAVVGASGWTARPGFADGTWQVFEFVPERPPVQITERAVTLVVSQIEVNETVGEAGIEITEETSPTKESFTPKTTVASVMKFPAEFVFRNFRPTKVMVANGEHAVLRWDGSTDAAYTMFWARNSSQDVSSVREWTTPEPLTTPTGFMLQATVTAGGQTLTHTLTTAVMVERPDLEIGHLDIAGRTTFRGPLEGLIQDEVLLLESTRSPDGEVRDWEAEFRVQGPGFVVLKMRVFDLPDGPTASASVRHLYREVQAATVYLTSNGRDFDAGSATQPFKTDDTIRCMAEWPNKDRGGKSYGAAQWFWYPLGPQEPPVRV
ncbi:hypothetical protein ACFVTP_18060 [Streptomyces celluloflavus]|uniref:hypothetical protein n=1 Tax=Streptomyces celluloflavus TaxID=58344 RepID=UPI0036DBA99F